MSGMCVVEHAQDWRRPETGVNCSEPADDTSAATGGLPSPLVCRVTTFCCPSMKCCAWRTCCATWRSYAVAGMLCYVARACISRCWSYASPS